MRSYLGICPEHRRHPAKALPYGLTNEEDTSMAEETRFSSTSEAAPPAARLSPQAIGRPEDYFQAPDCVGPARRRERRLQEKPPDTLVAPRDTCLSEVFVRSKLPQEPTHFSSVALRLDTNAIR